MSDNFLYNSLHSDLLMEFQNVLYKHIMYSQKNIYFYVNALYKINDIISNRTLVIKKERKPQFYRVERQWT